MTAIGVGLIGTGYMGKCHALAWNAVHAVFGDGPTPRLVHLAEIDAELAAARAAEFGFARSTADWQEVVADPEVDAVSVATPNAFHARMAIAALESGKHVWCEKPMASSLVDAERMRDASRAAGKVAILGYNYIQNPAIRHIAKLLHEGAIGTVNHVRAEMDEDFMADPAAPFFWKHDAASGHGALDDFGVHPLSLMDLLFGPMARVIAQQSRPVAARRTKTGESRAVETWDIASVLFELKSGVSGVMALDRAAWGRKGRLALQIFGDTGSILYDQERMNEIELYRATAQTAEEGFTTILTAPAHPPYGRFVPAPGHGLGFNDLKIIECHELLRAIGGEEAWVMDFERGYRIEQTVDAMARSHAERRWIEV